MKTIKIIDLFNKIANGEELPLKIKYIGYIFEYYTNHERYEAYIDGEICTLNEYVNINYSLNDEVEIIEKTELDELLEDLKNKDISVDDLTHNDKVRLIECITNLQEENEKLLKKSYSDDVKITKAIEYMNNYIELEDAPINERIKIEFKEIIKLLNGGDKE